MNKQERSIEYYSRLKEGDSLYVIESERIHKRVIYKIKYRFRGLQVFTHDVMTGEKHVYRYYSHTESDIHIDSMCNKYEYSYTTEGPWEERSGRFIYHWNKLAAFDNIIDAENYRNK